MHLTAQPITTRAFAPAAPFSPSLTTAIPATPWSERMQSAVFGALWQNVSVYNLLFEDSEVDEALLDLDADSRIVAISGAGCGVAGMLASRPRRIDAIDLNHHHLALTALKCAAVRGERSHERLTALLRDGKVRSSLDAVGPLCRHMPSWAQRYWGEHHGRFEEGLYRTGLTARMLGSFRAVAGLDARWLRAAIPMTPAQRVRHLEGALLPLLRTTLARAFLSSPAQLLALGINYAQRARLLATEEVPDMAAFIAKYLRRLCETDLSTNWFVWYAVTGGFNPDRADCAPPYLRRERHERALEATTDLRLHRRGIVDYLRTRSPRSVSHFALLDVPDWLSATEQRALFAEVSRTATDGATLLFRSVEDESPIDRLELGRRFSLDANRTRIATDLDRTRQYRAVRFYRVSAA